MVEHAVGPNAAANAACVVAGKIAGPDSIDNSDVLRHGGMSRLFAWVRAAEAIADIDIPSHHAESSSRLRRRRRRGGRWTR